MIRIGLIINPIAGLGGRVGLKGTDGFDTLKEAIKRGARPIAEERTKQVLEELQYLQGRIVFVTGPRELGENCLKSAGFDPEIIELAFDYDEVSSVSLPDTTSETTAELAKAMIHNVDLLLFAGGDGTACDIVKIVAADIPLIGIPCGVKMYSSVFAVSPQAAAKLVDKAIEKSVEYCDGEILDIDEHAFRNDNLAIKLCGIALTPSEPLLVQSGKSISADSERENQQAIAEWVIEIMEENVYYVLGPGSSVNCIAEQLKLDGTKLGVDIIMNKNMIAKDVNESQLLYYLSKEKTKIYVSPIGSQGFILGRGNQQISSNVLQKVGKENLVIIATRQKLASCNNMLRVDTGDTYFDKSLSGYIRAIIDYNLERAVRII